MNTTTSTATPRVLQIDGCTPLSVLAIPPTITSPTEAAVTRVEVVPVPRPTSTASTGYPNLLIPARADGNRHQRRAAAKARRSKEGRERAAWYESLYSRF